VVYTSKKKLHEEIISLLKESPRSIRQLHKILLEKKFIEIKNPMFLSGYLRAMEDLGLPIGHTESGGANFYYFKHKEQKEITRK
jgi:uncharacterized protein YdaT